MGYPPLAGPAFIGSWSTRNTRDLFGLIQTTMPTDRPAGTAGRHLREHHRVHPAVERTNAGAPAAHRRTHRSDWRTQPRRGDCHPHRPLHKHPHRQDERPDQPRARVVRGRRARRSRRRQSPVSPSRAKSRTSRASPTRCCAIRAPGDWPMLRRDHYRVELQPADADHARQRAGSAAGVGRADGRRRHESAVAARAQRHDLPEQHRRHHPGARRQDRRSDLGAASRQQHRDARHDALRRQAVSSR